MTGFKRTSNYTPGDFAPDTYRSGSAEPATLTEAWAALNHEGPSADAVRSYLASNAEPRYDTPGAKAEAQADREAGS